MDDVRSNVPAPAPQGSTPPAAPASPTPPAPALPHREIIKETIESILVAFILAFVFRAFVVEAFVIPTGSMAPTLLGAHMRFRCDDCGYDYDVNFPTENTGDDDLVVPSATSQEFTAHCPNCGFRARQPKGLTPVHYGDRILVLKYLYLFQEPRRWDVVVFKSPTLPASRKPEYAQNFIKRLVGKPGETLMILDGDVYVCPNDKAALKRGSSGRVTLGQTRQLPWQIQRKPRVAQDALWRVIYDNDFRPLNSEARRSFGVWTMPWQQVGGSGWDIGGNGGNSGRIVEFNNPAGAGTMEFVRLKGIQPLNRGTHPFTDWLPYNETKDRYSGSGGDAYGDGRVPSWFVSDLKVQFYYQRESGDGPLRVTMTKLDDAFTAELVPGKARLLRSRSGGEARLMAEADLPGSPNSPLRVEFMNVDYQVTLRVNGSDLIRTGEDYSPNLADLLERYGRRGSAARDAFGVPQVKLTAERQISQLAHLSLWRDIYYTPGYGYSSYDTINGSPETPVTLHLHGDGEGVDNEYFVLGDNSILSSDARAWRDPVELMEDEHLRAEAGRVPERFLLGKAFFVYWPAGFRPFSSGGPGIVPNFGNMRFIH